jgi:hypothetical protein
MTIRNPQPTMRRDFGDRSWTLALAKKTIGRAIAVRPPRQSTLLHHMPATCEAVEGAQSERTTHGAQQGRGETQARETHWQPRSTLLLIVSIAALFWGVFFWFFFG